MARANDELVRVIDSLVRAIDAFKSREQGIAIGAAVWCEFGGGMGSSSNENASLSEAFVVYDLRELQGGFPFYPLLLEYQV